MFITFTKNYDHFSDNIKNGFLLNEHEVEFLPSTYELISSLIKLWDEYRIEGEPYTFVRGLRDKHGGLNDEFWSELTNKMRSEFAFNARVALTLGQFKSAKFKMKCFTEIRDNQKINKKHTGYFGEYGILMHEKWLIQKGGCPVIYVSNSSKLTNILARNLSIMKTLDQCVCKLTKMRSLSTHGAFFDLMAFAETSKNRSEYEWRIVSKHNLGGESVLSSLERAVFQLSDVHSLYVPDEVAKEQTIKFLETIEQDSAKIPKVFLTKEILLSDNEIQQIEKIQSRQNC